MDPDSFDAPPPPPPPPLSSSPQAATRTAHASAAQSRNRSLLDTISPSVRWFGQERTRFEHVLRGALARINPRNRSFKPQPVPPGSYPAPDVVVAGGRPLPDLPALVRRLRRRRDRRPARDHRPPRPPRVARNRRHLAESDHAVAQRRLGLRRRRLLRRAPRSWHAGGPRRARRGGRQARDPRAAGPRPQPHERPPCLVPGRAHRTGCRAPRALRLGRPRTRRRAAQQLGVGVRRARRGRCTSRPASTTCTTSCPPSPT